MNENTFFNFRENHHVYGLWLPLHPHGAPSYSFTHSSIHPAFPQPKLRFTLSLCGHIRVGKKLITKSDFIVWATIVYKMNKTFLQIGDVPAGSGMTIVLDGWTESCL